MVCFHFSLSPDVLISFLTHWLFISVFNFHRLVCFTLSLLLISSFILFSSEQMLDVISIFRLCSLLWWSTADKKTVPEAHLDFSHRFTTCCIILDKWLNLSVVPHFFIPSMNLIISLTL